MGSSKIWKCNICDHIFPSKHVLRKHLNDSHNGQINFPMAHRPCQFCGRTFKYQHNLAYHETGCALNPNRVIRHGHVWSKESRVKMSTTLKNGYSHGKYKGWMVCHSSRKSYPERFFTKVIESDFSDKNYVYNMLFCQYRLDFAWPNKKLCIEIDGSQHERTEQHESDKRKDKRLRSSGWKVLRIKWKDMFHHPAEYIKQAKRFIESGRIYKVCIPT